MNLVCPLFEFRIMRQSALNGDRIVAGATRRFMISAVVAAVAMPDDFGSAPQRANFAGAHHGFVVPQDAKFEVFVRIEPLGVFYESLSHFMLLLKRSIR